MKRLQTPKRITPAQHSRFLRSIILLVLLAIAWLLFSPGGGVIHYLHKRKQIHRLTEETSQLAAENSKLQQDIEHVQKDRAFLEQVAREKHGLLRENERVFDFSATPVKENDEPRD
jgi:cell division protein FtsB